MSSRNTPHVLLSNETEAYGSISFFGYVVSCRNLGHVLFFILQDQFGFIQGVLEQTNLNRKLTTFLVGKKISVVGSTRPREQKSTSSNEVNQSIEIQISECFWLNDQKEFQSILEELPTQAGVALLEKQLFDQLLFSSHLINKIRNFLMERNFLEIAISSSEDKKKLDLNQTLNQLEEISYNAFSRHFHFKKMKSDLELHLAFETSGLEELLSELKNIINSILPLFNHPQIETLDQFSSSTCFASFGSLLPDLRLPFQIWDVSPFFKNLGFASCLKISSWKYSAYEMDSLTNFVRKQTGSTIFYGRVDEEKIEGILENTFSTTHQKSLIDFMSASQGDLLLFSLDHTLSLTQQTLGIVVFYLRENKIFALQGMKGAWIQQEETSPHLTTYSLVLNGKEVGFSGCRSDKNCESFKIGSLILKLNDFDFDTSPKNQKTILPLSEKEPKQLTISTEKLNEMIGLIDLEEKEQILALADRFDVSATDDPLLSLAQTLTNFAMSVEDASFLIHLLEDKTESILSLPKYELFQFLWSLLGHKHIVEILKHEKGKLTLQYLCELKIITDYKQILFLHLKTLLNIDLLLHLENRSPEELEWIVKLLKMSLNSFPSQFSNTVVSLITFLENGMIESNSLSMFLQAGKKGVSTPIFFKFFIANLKNKRALDDFISIVKSLHIHVFQNIQIDSSFLTKTFLKKIEQHQITLSVQNEHDLFFEILYFLFKPVNMDLESFKDYFTHVKESTSHLTNLKILFGGTHWNSLEQCFEYKKNPFFLSIYPSKNRASFFAKAASGICTGIDLDLYHRPDHFHLNLVSPEDRQVIGNIQAYVLNNYSERVLLIRGINPSANFINLDNVNFLLDAVIKCTIQIAEKSGLDTALLCPSLGIWHVESSRKEMIAALRILSKALPVVKLENPFLLFRFANQDKNIDFGYKLWSKRQLHPSILDEILAKKQEPAWI